MEKTLNYDQTRWQELIPRPVNTLQLFITNKCNNRCKACFYAHNLGTEEMSFNDYKKTVMKYSGSVAKVILLGGEPTLHKDLARMIGLNNVLGLKTTVYTNGINIKALEQLDETALDSTTIRIGVYGAFESEKPLAKVPDTDLPVTIVYMLRKDNVDELEKTVKMAEERFNCKEFYISSIRDIAVTHDYWKETDETLPLEEYSQVVQEFVKNYNGKLQKFHISKRGVLESKKKLPLMTKHCRFGNVFPDGKKIICPLDISRKIYCPELGFRSRKCNKHTECLLQKIVLERV
jgi:MoaA/NifB/PqqE/SkfB family radical SAM enzyme